VIARRRFVAGLAGALASPAGIAQSTSTPRRIAFLFYASRQAAYDTGRYQAFVEGLRDAGLVEGRDVEVLARYADGDAERVRAISQEAMRAKVDVIVATGSPIYRVLREAKVAIPVVVTVGPDPVAVGLAASIARPGGQFTGLTDAAESLIPKQLELMRAAVPRLATIGTMINPTNDSHRPQSRRLAAIAIIAFGCMWSTCLPGRKLCSGVSMEAARGLRLKVQCGKKPTISSSCSTPR